MLYPQLVESRQRDFQLACRKLVIEISNAFDMPTSAIENPFRGAN